MMGILDKLAAKVLRKPAETPEARQKRIVGEYINTCSRYGEGTISDIRLLPHPKEEIQAAMLWLMENNQRMCPALAPIFIGTAIYQTEAGARDAIEQLNVVEAEMGTLKAILRSKALFPL